MNYENNENYFFNSEEKARDAVREYRQQVVDEFYNWAQSSDGDAEYREMSYDEIDNDFIVIEDRAEFTVECTRCGDLSSARFLVTDADVMTRNELLDCIKHFDGAEKAEGCRSVIFEVHSKDVAFDDWTLRPAQCWWCENDGDFEKWVSEKKSEIADNIIEHYSSVSYDEGNIIFN